MNVIGGPAIRRTEDDVVYIWLVTDEQPHDIRILSGLSDSLNDTNAIAVGNVSSSEIIKLGDNLYTALIPVRSKGNTYPKDLKIYYDVFIDGASLRDLNLISNSKPIVYKGQNLPSFILPTKHTNILQGSCRKPHAGKVSHSQFDQIVKIDTNITKAISNDLNSRPSILCLTGDQIYADDVAVPLLCALRENGNKLTGWEESLPQNDSSINTLSPSSIKLGDREKYLVKDIGFSSGKTKNHLMTFGEYTSMYLAVWGGLELNLPEYTTIIDKIGRRYKTVRRGKKRIRVKKPIYTQDDYNEEKNIVENFLKNTWKMRRVMANITTYMIFDDHEVTDDWNLTENNHHELRNHPLSRRIQSNALASYWFCQGWGNNPTEFTDNFKINISNHLISKSNLYAKKFENTILNKKYWGYEVTGFPYIIVLDTRSDRVFSDEEPFSQLMSEKRLKSLGTAIRKINKIYMDDIEQQSILLVSASPILGFKSIERIQLLFNFIPTTVDGEPWIGSEVAYNNLLSALKNIKFKYCSVFSGDVHYSYVRQLQINRYNSSPLILNQYTSSALHNSPNGVARFFLNILSNAERLIFNRGNSPYLYPNNMKDKDEFLCGNTSYGLLELENGIPKYNTYSFTDSNSRKSFKWKYYIQNPIKVQFTESDD